MLSLSSSSSFVPRGLRFATWSALAGLTANPLPVLAQPAVDIPEIIIYANQFPTEASRVGASATVLMGETMRSKGFSTVAEALRTVPGLSVNQSGGPGALTQARIRGSESNHVLVLIDDVPVNDFANGDFNFADFSLEDVERVEVIRGPQSGIYGANAHSGIISIVTRTGRGLARPQADFRVEGGSRQTAAASGSVRGAAGPFYGAFSFAHNTTDGHNISRFGSERDGSHATTTTAKVGVELTPAANIEAAFRRAARFTHFDSQPFFGPFEGLTFDSVYDFNRTENLLGRIAATWSLFDGALVQKLSASRYEERRNDDDVVNGFFRSKGQRDDFAYKATLKHNTDIVGGEQHTLALAVDRQHERLTIDSASFVFDPSAGAFWAAGAERTRTGLAGEYGVNLPFGLTLTGAVRHDWNSGFADATTWRATASQRFPSTRTRLHGSVGTGITNPNFIEQFGFFVGTFIGNPALRPERSIGWDFGVEQSFWGGRLITDVTYFGADFEDKITFGTAGGGFIATPINVPGVSPRRGVEVSARVTPVNWFTLTAAYTYTDARLADGTREIRRPEHAASGSATVRFLGGRGRATVNVVYNGKMADSWFRFPITPVELEAYTTVGGIIEYDVAPYATAFVRAENVFNARYEEVFSYRAPGSIVLVGLKLRTI
ncbi:MAG: TonB-dependent receptor plug domain-containing protein [Rhizobiales bacterium]|nr:TonB-dependent receptor plug domain-containing protein [Hyphomicrobiales bacterium]